MTRSPDLDAQHRIGGQHNVHPRAKFDEAHALAALDRLALAQAEDDAAGQQTGDLLEGYLNAAVGALARAR